MPISGQLRGLPYNNALWVIFTGGGCIQSKIKCSQYNWKFDLLIQIDTIYIKPQNDTKRKIGT